MNMVHDVLSDLKVAFSCPCIIFGHSRYHLSSAFSLPQGKQSHLLCHSYLFSDTALSLCTSFFLFQHIYSRSPPQLTGSTPVFSEGKAHQEMALVKDGTQGTTLLYTWDSSTNSGHWSTLLHPLMQIQRIDLLQNARSGTELGDHLVQCSTMQKGKLGQGVEAICPDHGNQLVAQPGFKSRSSNS